MRRFAGHPIPRQSLPHARSGPMRVKILGSAAGGGFPQWNCACPNCAGLRAGTLNAKPRSQSQIAFCPGPSLWFLVGSSPDLRTQLAATPELAPSNSRNAIAGVFLRCPDAVSAIGLLHPRLFQHFFVSYTAGI